MLNDLLNKKWVYNITIAIMTIGMILAIFSPFALWAYTQRYVVDDNGITATKGIMFEKTIYLKEYKHLGDGNGLFGEYDRYSRSDRHTDVLSVYKD